MVNGDAAAAELKTAVMSYFGIADKTGSKRPRQLLARMVLAILAQQILQESVAGTEQVSRLDRRTLAKLREAVPQEVQVHLEPVVRSMKPKTPFLRVQTERWLDAQGGERQSQLPGIA